MMKIIYDEQRETEERFTYKVNAGGDLGLFVGSARERELVTIVFINGKLDKVDWEDPNTKGFLRSSWHVYGAIAAKITDLEERLGVDEVSVGSD